MRYIGHFCSARLASGVLFGLLVIMLSPSSASAACGDYVSMGSKSSDQLMSGSDHMAPHLPLAPSSRNTPCSGPHCSKGSLPPAPAPAGPAPEHSEHRGC